MYKDNKWLDVHYDVYYSMYKDNKWLDVRYDVSEEVK